MNESQYTKAVCEEMEQCGASVIPYVGNTRQRNGVPDRWVGHSLFSGWLEFKTLKGRLSLGQKICIERLNRSVKGTAYVIRSNGNVTCGRIENEKGKVLAMFSNGYDLLLKLFELSEQ